MVMIPDSLPDRIFRYERNMKKCMPVEFSRLQKYLNHDFQKKTMF